MPRTYTVTNLIARCRQRCDLENHEVISDAEWKTLLDEQYGELYTIVFEAGLSYFEYTSDLVTDGTNVLNESTDHLSTVELSYLSTASPATYRDLRELMSQERSSLSGQTGTATCFALVDDKIYLYPTPPSGQTYRLRYIPQPPDLSTYAGSDVVDVVTPDGLAFLIWGVAVKALAKVEGDPRLAVSEREGARVRFAESVQLRALNAPRRRIVSDDEIDDERYGW